MVLIAWFQIAVGVAIAGLWTTLLGTRQVPEIAEGRRDIWFHVGAELLTAAVLVAAGAAVLTVGGAPATVLSALATGALLYTTVNSPGYYADLGQWAVVAAFGVLCAAALASAVALVQSQAG